MRKTFGIERRSFLPNSIPEVENMFGSIFVSLSRHLRSIQNHSTSQLFFQLHLLILRWCALIVLYGETAPSLALGHEEN
jgi:hypothetical protein